MIYSVQFGRWWVGLVSSPCDMGRHTGGELRTGHHGTDTRTTRARDNTHFAERSGMEPCRS